MNIIDLELNDEDVITIFTALESVIRLTSNVDMNTFPDFQ